MDRNQFDRLSRVVAAAGTRRDALRLLLAGLAVGSTAAVEEASARKKGRGKSGRAQSEQSLQCTRLCAPCPKKKPGPGTNLTGCDFNDADLVGVNLGGANLTNTCFASAHLHNARFRGANVSGTCFCGADLTGADFRGTKVSAEQLACATVDCSTVLPNGKPAAPCGDSTTCCGGDCVDLQIDTDNCGKCGNACGPCQTCSNGSCRDLTVEDQVDCNRNPLEPAGGDKVCTTSPFTGICDLGHCNCGPDGRYLPDENICLCSEACGPNQHCDLTSTCLDNGVFSNETTGCVTNLCCEYVCGPNPNKYACIPNATPGETQCNPSLDGCSINDASFVDSCDECPGQ
jgi:hypothetical protein